jgi:hypothetical protein
MIAPFIPDVTIASSLQAQPSLLTTTLPISTSTTTTLSTVSSTTATATMESMSSLSVPFGQSWLQTLTPDLEVDHDEEEFEGIEFIDDGALSPTELQIFTELAQQCASAAETSNNEYCCFELGSAPTSIDDVYSSILGDMFHFMDRAKVPVHHEYKKSFYYSLSEAMLI